MFKTIERLYRKTRNKTVVANAVAKGWITAEDYAVIVGEKMETDISPEELSVPQGLVAAHEIPEDAVLTRMETSDSGLTVNSDLVEIIRARVSAGENLRTIISSLDLTDEDKWELERMVKEG